VEPPTAAIAKPPLAEPPVDDPAPGAEQQASNPTQQPTSPRTMNKRKKVLIGSVSGVVAIAVIVTLVVTLVVLPRQRAAAEANQAAFGAHQAAVSAFNAASQDCQNANSDLTNTITVAQDNAQVDPSTLEDPSLVSQLNTALANAQAVTPCVPPTMADDTATIQQQTATLRSDTGVVTDADQVLATASQAVASAEAQSQADAEASAPANDNATSAPADNGSSSDTGSSGSTSLQTYTAVRTDASGNKEKVTVQVSEWIKGSDSAGLDQAWSDVGGQGSMPLVDGTSIPSGGEDWGISTFNASESAYFFGTIMIQNMTTGFPAANYNNGQILVYFDDVGCGNASVCDQVGTQPAVVCFGYSDQTQCSAAINDNAFASADMTGGDTWGPVPFVFGMANVFSPDDPDGKALTSYRFSTLDSPVIQAGTDKYQQGESFFTVKRSW